MIGQIKGEYEAKEERMQKYLRLTKHLTREFDVVEFVQIPRSQNMGADEVSKLASSEKKGDYHRLGDGSPEAPQH